MFENNHASGMTTNRTKTQLYNFAANNEPVKHATAAKNDNDVRQMIARAAAATAFNPNSNPMPNLQPKLLNGLTRNFSDKDCRKSNDTTLIESDFGSTTNDFGSILSTNYSKILLLLERRNVI